MNRQIYVIFLLLHKNSSKICILIIVELKKTFFLRKKGLLFVLNE